MPELDCWQCRSSVDPDEVVWSAVLLPRTARDGGPMLLFTCGRCKAVNLVERNGAGERLLSSPAVAGYRPPGADDAEAYAAVRWAEANRALREAFLARTGRAEPPRPAPPRRTAPTAAREPLPGPGPRAGEAAEQDAPALSEAADLIDAYEALDLPLTATAQQIRDRYRMLARKCHPDRVSDLDEDIRRLADRKFRRLKSAFELIRRRTGPPGPSGTRS